MNQHVADLSFIGQAALGDETFLIANMGAAALLLLLLGLAFWRVNHYRRSPAQQQPRFELLTLGEGNKEIVLEDKVYTMDFLSQIATKGQLRLSSNLNKVFLSPRQDSFLLEDKNYKNALLINRRRIRRTLLEDGDILDVGDWTLLYRNPVKHEPIIDEEPLLAMKYEKPRGPLRKGIASLVSEQSKQEFYITRNLAFIGRSTSCDLVLEGKNIAMKHAKIVRIGGQYKIQNLSLQEGTYVNNRRIEQRFITDGDQICFDNYRFKFRIGR